MNNYRTILEDILMTSPDEVILPPPPYSEHMNLDEKFDAINDALERAKQLDNRLLQLTNMFYLGHFLEKIIKSKPLRSHYKQKLTIHYRITAVRIYYIFEIPGIHQIMRTTRTSLTLVRGLSKEEYQSLIAEVFQNFQRS
jgi:hypothetical protein